MKNSLLAEREKWKKREEKRLIKESKKHADFGDGFGIDCSSFVEREHQSSVNTKNYYDPGEKVIPGVFYIPLMGETKTLDDAVKELKQAINDGNVIKRGQYKKDDYRYYYPKHELVFFATDNIRKLFKQKKDVLDTFKNTVKIKERQHWFLNYNVLLSILVDENIETKDESIHRRFCRKTENLSDIFTKLSAYINRGVSVFQIKQMYVFPTPKDLFSEVLDYLCKNQRVIDLFNSLEIAKYFHLSSDFKTTPTDISKIITDLEHLNHIEASDLSFFPANLIRNQGGNVSFRNQSGNVSIFQNVFYPKIELNSKILKDGNRRLLKITHDDGFLDFFEFNKHLSFILQFFNPAVYIDDCATTKIEVDSNFNIEDGLKYLNSIFQFSNKEAPIELPLPKVENIPLLDSGEIDIKAYVKELLISNICNALNAVNKKLLDFINGVKIRASYIKTELQSRNGSYNEFFSVSETPLNPNSANLLKYFSNGKVNNIDQVSNAGIYTSSLISLNPDKNRHSIPYPICDKLDNHVSYDQNLFKTEGLIRQNGNNVFINTTGFNEKNLYFKFTKKEMNEENFKLNVVVDNFYGDKRISLATFLNTNLKNVKSFKGFPQIETLVLFDPRALPKIADHFVDLKNLFIFCDVTKTLVSKIPLLSILKLKNLESVQIASIFENDYELTRSIGFFRYFSADQVTSFLKNEKDKYLMKKFNGNKISKNDAGAQVCFSRLLNSELKYYFYHKDTMTPFDFQERLFSFGLEENASV